MNFKVGDLVTFKKNTEWFSTYGDQICKITRIDGNMVYIKYLDNPTYPEGGFYETRFERATKLHRALK